MFLARWPIPKAIINDLKKSAPKKEPSRPRERERDLASRSRRARVALASRSRRALVAPSLTKLRESRVAGGNAKEPPVEFQDRGPASTAKLSPLLVLSSSIYECERTVATNLYSRPRHKTRAAPPAEIKWEINFLVVSSQLSVYTCCEEF